MLNVNAFEATPKKPYLVITENKAVAQKIDEEYGNDISISEIDAEKASEKNQVNSSYIGASDFNSEIESLEETMIASGSVVAELTEDEMDDLADNDSVIAVEEDIEIKANSLSNNHSEKVKFWDEYYKRKAENQETVTPDWNMKAIDADKIIRYSEHPEKEKNIKFGKGLTKNKVDKFLKNNRDHEQGKNEKKTKNATEKGAPKVKVAVLDSGVDIVEGLDISEEINLVPEDQEITMMYQDMTGHGTAIASVIAGNNENGLQGVNDNVELCSVKVLDRNNSAPLSRIIEGIYWCIDNNVNIINMSFGTHTNSKALYKAVKDAYDAGILMVAASGNSGLNGDGATEYPAAYDEVMAVASSNELGEISDFSNIDGNVDVAAPGEKIPVTGFFGLTGITHGTSIAVPHVTGVASLLWEKDISKSADYIRKLIEYSTKKIKGNDFGLLDAEEALVNYDEFEKIYESTVKAINSGGLSVGIAPGINGVENPGEEILKNVLKDCIDDNQDKIEKFDEVSDDKAYVEGRWLGDGHRECIVQISGLTNAEYNLLKKGVVAPDDNALYGLHSDNPEWHGKYKDNASQTHNCNYIATYSMQTKAAILGGDASGISKKFGMSDFYHNRIKKQLTSKYFGDMDWGSVMSWIGNYSNTKHNRTYFLYGAAIHNLTDTMAHSIYVNNAYLVHQANVNDNINYKSNRFTVAKQLAKNAITNLQNGWEGDYYDFYKAFKDKYSASSAYKVAKLLTYAKQNASSNNFLLTNNENSVLKSASAND